MRTAGRAWEGGRWGGHNLKLALFQVLEFPNAVMNDINTCLTNTGISNEANNFTYAGGSYEGALRAEMNLFCKAQELLWVRCHRLGPTY